MTFDLDDRVRAAMRADADLAPLAAPEWEGPRYGLAAPRRRPALLAAVAAVVLGALAVGTALTVSTRGPDGDAGQRPPFLRGDEYALVPVDPPDLGYSGLVRPGSVQAARLPDLDLVVATFEAGIDSPTSPRQRCAFVGGVVTGCRDQPGQVNFQLPVPGHDEYVWLATWDNVPAGTAYVQFLDPDGTARWQRPLGSTAVFRASANMPTLRAYDADGHEIPFPPTNIVPG